MLQKKRIYELHAEICKALSHPKRLEILDVLRTGEHAVEEIARETGIQKSNLSQHLAVLRKNRLVTTRRDGLNIFYSVENEALLEACDLLKRVLASTLVEQQELASVLRGEQ